MTCLCLLLFFFYKRSWRRCKLKATKKLQQESFQPKTNDLFPFACVLYLHFNEIKKIGDKIDKQNIKIIISYISVIYIGPFTRRQEIAKGGEGFFQNVYSWWFCVNLEMTSARKFSDVKFEGWCLPSKTYLTTHISCNVKNVLWKETLTCYIWNSDGGERRKVILVCSK